ncbi:hypothetical protein GF327_09670 [Candidatus Woesearchaeota archaeon]|nr:hypothetical protein [Candidatus Woesearchaeota archaeon]
MTQDWFPVIDSVRCRGNCSICINFCPRDVFEKEVNFAVVSRPNNCLSGCDSCKEICPEKAITFLKTRMIDVNGNKVGIKGLAKAFENNDFTKAYEEIKKNNYIPDSAEKEFREAIKKEFDKKKR